MIQTELDQPPDIPMWRCKVCGDIMHDVRHYWVLNRWLHATIHERCVEVYNKNLDLARKNKVQVEREMPERFREFDPQKADQGALSALQAFWPDSKVKTLALVGVRARGKSRMMWAVIGQFFDILEHETGAKRWVEYFLFSDLISELDRGTLNRFKIAKHAFLDDVGSVESFGRERAALQQVVRARVQKGENWTFLTIDSLKFDDGLEDLLRGRSVTVYLDK
jgi:hypothetical protein